MKITVAAVVSCFVLTALLWAQPASAAEAKAKKVVDDSKLVAAKTTPTELGQPPNVPPTTKPVKPPKPPKPERSKKNPNDDKDNDPDDGNAGGGNDDNDTKNDDKKNDGSQAD